MVEVEASTGIEMVVESGFGFVIAVAGAVIEIEVGVEVEVEVEDGNVIQRVIPLMLIRIRWCGLLSGVVAGSLFLSFFLLKRKLFERFWRKFRDLLSVGIPIVLDPVGGGASAPLPLTFQGQVS